MVGWLSFTQLPDIPKQSLVLKGSGIVWEVFHVFLNIKYYSEMCLGWLCLCEVILSLKLRVSRGGVEGSMGVKMFFERSESVCWCLLVSFDVHLECKAINGAVLGGISRCIKFWVLLTGASEGSVLSGWSQPTTMAQT